MPASIYERERRKPLRRDLRAYMDAGRVTPREIAAYITKQRQTFGGIIMTAYTVRRFLDERPESSKVGNKYVEALDIFLKLRTNAPDGMPPRAPFFPAAAAFFGMIPAKGERYCGAVIGDYTFYAHSETKPGKVSRGALSFSSLDGELCVFERQETIPSGGKKPYRETYAGHFLFRKDAVIAMLGEQGHQGRAFPKFYILSITSATDEDDRKQVMCGVMMKFGEHKSIFTSYVHLVRNDDALKECAVIPRDKVDPDILEYLDGDMWERGAL